VTSYVDSKVVETLDTEVEMDVEEDAEETDGAVVDTDGTIDYKDQDAVDTTSVETMAVFDLDEDTEDAYFATWVEAAIRRKHH
jgi:hypothetical protein